MYTVTVLFLSKLTKTEFYENNFSETWIGTDSGLIFYGQNGWLESIFLGIPQILRFI